VTTGIAKVHAGGHMEFRLSLQSGTNADDRPIPIGGILHRPYPQRHQRCRPPSSAAHEILADHQPQNGQGTRVSHPADVAPADGSGHRVIMLNQRGPAPPCASRVRRVLDALVRSRASRAPNLARLLARHRPRRRWDAPPGLRPAAGAVRRARLAGDLLHDRHGALADQRDGHPVGAHAFKTSQKRAKLAFIHDRRCPCRCIRRR